MTQVFWKVSLSNGETYIEGKGNYQEIEGQPLPFRRLTEYAKENDLKITSLSLFTNSGQNYNLPSAGRNPRFRAFDLSVQPIEYRCFEKYGEDVNSGVVVSVDLFKVIRATYEDGSFIEIWVDENNTNNIWVNKG
jgi:hypothetical protein